MIPLGTDEEILADCDVETLKGSGPGGQHRNKTESAVRLFHRPTGLKAQAGERRSQGQNMGVAVERLRALLQVFYAPPPKPRRPTKPSKGARERRMRAKAVRSKVKAGRSDRGE
jgi:protein subunit release factor B